MDVWDWLVVYVVGFVLFQLLVFRYVRGGSNPRDVAPGAALTADPPVTDFEGGHDAGRRRDDGRYCSHCGARNEDDPTFTYCRECANPL
ncbi:MAG: hypothetical protein ABEI96_05250 [Haloarculaceae archaeon]